MKTTDLPIGEHVAWDRYGGTGYQNFIEAYVMAHRPKGRKGYGTNNTVGIAVVSQWEKDTTGNYCWTFQWVRPATIHYKWSEWETIQNTNKRTKAHFDEIRRQEREARLVRFNELPIGVQELFKDYQKESILTHGIYSHSVTVEWLEELVEAVKRYYDLD